VAVHYEYSPFGRPVASTGSQSDAFMHRFSTKYLDDETNLYYYGLRYYSSELGRWISRDPIGETGGLALFSFTWNSPVILFDGLGDNPRWAIPVANVLNMLIPKEEAENGVSLSLFERRAYKLFNSPLSAAELLGKGDEARAVGINSIRQAAFEFFDIQTEKDLFNNYWKTNPTDPYLLTPDEVAELDIDLDVYTNESLEEFRNERPDKKISYAEFAEDYSFNLSAFGRKLGGLNVFTAEVEGKMYCDKGDYVFVGDFKVKDTYNFDYDRDAAKRAVKDYYVNYNHPRSGHYSNSSRALGAELVVILMNRAGAALNGHEFEIRSKSPVPFYQKSTQKKAVINSSYTFKKNKKK